MSAALQQRDPTSAELFSGMAAALRRLGGDSADAAIEREMSADKPDFQRAADAIGVKVDDLVDCFAEEMAKYGFIVGRRWVQ